MIKGIFAKLLCNCQEKIYFRFKSPFTSDTRKYCNYEVLMMVVTNISDLRNSEIPEALFLRNMLYWKLKKLIKSATFTKSVFDKTSEFKKYFSTKIHMKRCLSIFN